MKRSGKFLPFLVLFLGFALRLYRLGANSLWYDETVSVFLAQSDLAELLRHTAGDIHPPFYYLLLHFWGRAAGWSEYAMAFLSLWLGVLLIALVYRVTREWAPITVSVLESSPAHVSREQGNDLTRAVKKSDASRFARMVRAGGGGAALAAAFLVAFSPYNVWYSQEVRMYTLGAALGLLSVYFLRRMLVQPTRRLRDFFAYVIFTVMGLYTLYYFAFLVVFEWLWVAYRVWRIAYGESRTAKRAAKTVYHSLIPFLLSQIALLVLYLPWLATAIRQAMDPPVPPWREFVALPRVLLETFSALAFGQAVDPNFFGVLALLLVVPIGALLWHEMTRRAQGTLHDAIYASNDTRFAARDTPSAFFLLGYFLVPLAAIYIASLWKPLYHVRYMFTYSPAFYILAAIAAVHLRRLLYRAWRTNSARLMYRLGTAAVCVSIGFFIVRGYSLYNFWYSAQYAEDDLRGAVNYIAEHWRPGDVILVNAGYAYPAVTYYFPDALRRERLVNFQVSSEDTPLLLMTGSIDGNKNLGWGDPRSDFYGTTADETRAALDGVMQSYSRVWVLRIYDTVVDPNGVIRAYFQEHATLLDDRVFSGESQARVQGYITHPIHDLPPGATRFNKNLGERVQLVGYETGARDVERGKFFDAVLYWKLLQAVNYNYQVTLQLLNGRGENVAQVDEVPLSELLPMTRWKAAPEAEPAELYREPLRLKIPDSLPPAEYRVIAKVYEPRSGEVLGDVVELGQVRVR